MKLSRAPSLRKKGVRRIKSELYRSHSAAVFGNQLVKGFQLCSINKPKSEEGYYYKAHEILFQQGGCVDLKGRISSGLDDASAIELLCEIKGNWLSHLMKFIILQ